MSLSTLPLSHKNFLSSHNLIAQLPHGILSTSQESLLRSHFIIPPYKTPLCMKSIKQHLKAIGRFYSTMTLPIIFKQIVQLYNDIWYAPIPSFIAWDENCIRRSRETRCPDLKWLVMNNWEVVRLATNQEDEEGDIFVERKVEVPWNGTLHISHLGIKSLLREDGTLEPFYGGVPVPIRVIDDNLTVIFHGLGGEEFTWTRELFKDSKLKKEFTTITDDMVADVCGKLDKHILRYGIKLDIERNKEFLKYENSKPVCQARKLLKTRIDYNAKLDKKKERAKTHGGDCGDHTAFWESRDSKRNSLATYEQTPKNSRGITLYEQAKKRDEADPSLGIEEVLAIKQKWKGAYEHPTTFKYPKREEQFNGYCLAKGMMKKAGFIWETKRMVVELIRGVEVLEGLRRDVVEGAREKPFEWMAEPICAVPLRVLVAVMD